jgi:CTP synthase
MNKKTSSKKSLQKSKTRYIFVLGGVISGLGKGVTSGSIAAILKEMGYNKITIKKLDPYLNVDPGTMNPVEHGEVYVTDDGAETDLDLGYYERFGEITVGKNNSVSSGKLLWNLLNAERKGDFLGKTVQFMPHFTGLIRNFIEKDANKFNFVICEIGGSAGDYEATYYFETIRRMILDYGKKKIMICCLTYILFYKASKELKTKPTQVAIKQLMTSGLQPDVLVARTEYKLNNKIRKKLALFTSIPVDNIIQAINVPSIYQIPLEFRKEGLVKCLTKHFNLKSSKEPTFKKWISLNKKITNTKKTVTIAMVGKYVELEDAYYSVIEALKHAGWKYNCNVEIVWVNARKTNDMYKTLKKVDGVVVPGGFGTSGIEEIIKGINFCRVNKIPMLGICLGLQLSVIEFARNVLGIKKASSSEFGKKGDTFIVDIMSEWISEDGLKKIVEKNGNLGGTMRLGEYVARLKKGSLAYKLYKKSIIKERHRHRYEVNINFKENFEKKGMIFSGLSLDGLLPEIIEIPEHPFFIAGQFHPEFKSTPFNPRPLFLGLIKASLKK